MKIEKEIEGLIHKTNKDLLNENANKDSRVFQLNGTLWLVLCLSTLPKIWSRLLL